MEFEKHLHTKLLMHKCNKEVDMFEILIRLFLAKKTYVNIQTIYGVTNY